MSLKPAVRPLRPLCRPLCRLCGPLCQLCKPLCRPLCQLCSRDPVNSAPLSRLFHIRLSSPLCRLCNRDPVNSAPAPVCFISVSQGHICIRCPDLLCSHSNPYDMSVRHAFRAGHVVWPHCPPISCLQSSCLLSAQLFCSIYYTVQHKNGSIQELQSL